MFFQQSTFELPKHNDDGRVASQIRLQRFIEIILKKKNWSTVLSDKKEYQTNFLERPKPWQVNSSFFKINSLTIACSLTCHKLSIFAGSNTANIMDTRLTNILFWSLEMHYCIWCFHMVVVRYRIVLKEMTHLWKHNLNSFTRPVPVGQVRQPPGVFGRLWICSIDWSADPWCSAIRIHHADVLFVAR